MRAKVFKLWDGIEVQGVMLFASFFCLFAIAEYTANLEIIF